MRDVLSAMLGQYGRRWQEKQQNLMTQAVERHKQMQGFWERESQRPDLVPGKREEATQNYFTYLQTVPGKKVKDEDAMFSKYFTTTEQVPAPADQQPQQKTPPMAQRGPAPGAQQYEKPMPDRKDYVTPLKPGEEAFSYFKPTAPAATPNAAQSFEARNYVGAPAPPPTAMITRNRSPYMSRAEQLAADLDLKIEAAKQERIAQIAGEEEAYKRYKLMYPEGDPRDLFAAATERTLPSQSGGDVARMQAKTVITRDPQTGVYDEVPGGWNPLKGKYYDLNGNEIRNVATVQGRLDKEMNLQTGNLHSVVRDGLGQIISWGGVLPLQQNTVTSGINPITQQPYTVSTPRQNFAPTGPVAAPGAPPGVAAPTQVAAAPTAPGATAPAAQRPPAQPAGAGVGAGAGAPPSGGSRVSGNTVRGSTVRPIEIPGLVTDAEQVIRQATDAVAIGQKPLKDLPMPLFNAVLDDADQRGIILMEPKQREDVRDFKLSWELVNDIRRYVNQLKVLQDPVETARVMRLLTSARNGVAAVIAKDVFRQSGVMSDQDVANAQALLPNTTDALFWKSLANEQLDFVQNIIQRGQQRYLESMTTPYTRNPSAPGGVSGPGVIPQQKTATRAEVQAYAAKQQITYDEALKSFLAAGFKIQ